MISSAHFHPMLVHFPIAIITIGFLFDLVALFFKKEPCLSKTGYWLTMIGMVGAIAAFSSGHLFTDPMEGEAGVVLERHELFATITLIAIVVTAIFRTLIIYFGKVTKNTIYLSLLLFFIAMVCVSITGYLGGSLVIDYMIGL